MELTVTLALTLGQGSPKSLSLCSNYFIRYVLLGLQIVWLVLPWQRTGWGCNGVRSERTPGPILLLDNGSRIVDHASKPRCSSGELLSQWEVMRTQLFGTGGTTVDGLFAGAESDPRRPRGQKQYMYATRNPRGQSTATTAGNNSTSDSPSRGQNSEFLSRRGRDERAGSGGFWRWGQGLTNPVLGCVAESLAPALTTQDMSDYMSRMQG